MSTTGKAKWFEFWQRLGVKSSPEPYFDGLAAHYSEAHRAYHNLTHILDCLEQFEPAKSLAQEPTAMEMAIWYHDVIYDPRARDNEQRSAELAVRVAKETGLAGSFQETIHALIMATKKHDASLARDAVVLVDVDLSILGRAPQRFNEYEHQIRQEYDWVPAEDFAAGRAAVLETFLARPTIYGTEFFRDKYERQARENLKQSIRHFSSP